LGGRRPSAVAGPFRRVAAQPLRAARRAAACTRPAAGRLRSLPRWPRAGRRPRSRGNSRR